MGKTKTARRLVTSRDEFESRLRSFVGSVAKDSLKIRKNTPLFATGLIDSLKVLDLVLIIEEAIGRTLSDDEITAESFRSIDSICSGFWSGQ